MKTLIIELEAIISNKMANKLIKHGLRAHEEEYVLSVGGKKAYIKRARLRDDK